MIYLLYGLPCAGKTTLGDLLGSYIKTPFWIDGDNFDERRLFEFQRELGGDDKVNSETLKKQFSVTSFGCIKDAFNAATYINKKSNDVVISGICMLRKNRDELKKNNPGEFTDVLLSSKRFRSERSLITWKDFEAGDPDHILNTDDDLHKTWRNLKILLKI